MTFLPVYLCYDITYHQFINVRLAVNRFVTIHLINGKPHAIMSPLNIGKSLSEHRTNPFRTATDRRH